MNRRGFLGFLGAGAAAGPKLATGLATEVAAGSTLVGGYLGGDPFGAVGGNPNYRVEHIARLKNLISGKDPSIKRERVMRNLYMAESVERFRLDGLRSVSACHKMRMFIDGSHDRQNRIRRQDAEFDLAVLLREKLPF
jgi:hypothetical protein